MGAYIGITSVVLATIVIGKLLAVMINAAFKN